MVEEEVDLGLSLGLGGASGSSHCNRQLPPPPQRSLTPTLDVPPPPSPLLAAQRRAPVTGTRWCDLLASSASEGRRNLPKSPFFMGIDVNRAPVAGGREPDEEEEGDGVSSPNSTVSSAVSDGGGGNSKRGEDEHRPNSSAVAVENELERALARVTSDEEDGGEGSRNKKLRLSKDQAAVLEETFREHHTLNPWQKLALAKQLNLSPRQVEVWFQNRRERTKLKQTEVDCELLRRCCEGLTAENRRLQKEVQEVQELRSLKLLSPHHYMHMAPPTTLTICPSCERLAAASYPPNPPQPHRFPLWVTGRRPPARGMITSSRSLSSGSVPRSSSPANSSRASPAPSRVSPSPGRPHRSAPRPSSTHRLLDERESVCV